MKNGRVIRDWNFFSRWFGRFYIIRTIWHEGAGFEHEFTYEYLHTDGQWRDTIHNESGEPTGLYTSKECAMAQLTGSMKQL